MFPAIRFRRGARRPRGGPDGAQQTVKKALLYGSPNCGGYGLTLTSRTLAFFFYFPWFLTPEKVGKHIQ